MGDDVNYSIRLDSELREEMREVDDMADRIRTFIRETVDEQQRGDLDQAADYYDLLHDHGKVGAYCLRQLVNNVPKDLYLENVETRFQGSEYERAGETARRVRHAWDDLNKIDREEFEEVIEELGYARQFERRARSIGEEFATDTEELRWAVWTLVALADEIDERSGGRKQYRIKRKSIARTLERGHGFDDEQVEAAFDAIVRAGGIHSLTNTNAYFYHYFYVPEYVVEGLRDGLERVRRERRNRVRELCESEAYIDDVRKHTSGEDRPYARVITDDTDEEIVNKLLGDGTAVLKYKPGRSSTGNRSSLPPRFECVLTPELRDVVRDAVYQSETRE